MQQLSTLEWGKRRRVTRNLSSAYFAKIIPPIELRSNKWLTKYPNETSYLTNDDETNWITVSVREQSFKHFLAIQIGTEVAW